MHTSYKRLICIISIFLVLSLLGCYSKIFPQAPFLPTLKIPGSMTVISSSSTVDATLTVSPILTGSNMGYFTIKLPKAQFVGKTREKIAEELFINWLSFFQTNKVDKHIRINNFNVNSVKEMLECGKMLDDTSFMKVNFSVQTIDNPAGDWYVPNGIEGKDNWVYDKFWAIAVYPIKDEYTFKLLGSPYCEGVAVDGSPVP